MLALSHTSLTGIGNKGNKKRPYIKGDVIQHNIRRSYSSAGTSSLANNKEIKVFDVMSNTTTIYLSVNKAASSLKVDVKSLNNHILSKSLLGLDTLYKDQYLVTVEFSKSQKFLDSIRSGASTHININTLTLNKLFAYYPDKKTIAYVFDNIVETCRTLAPIRSSKFTDSELGKKKNVQFILRVINKGVLTRTELGQFYLFKNPGYSSCLAVVVWGLNLCNTVGSVISKEERNMIKLPNYQYGVILGVLLSDGTFTITTRSINVSLRFKQSLSKSKYVWFVFSQLAHYCSSWPYLVKGERAGTNTMALEFYTRALPCIKEIYSMFYINGSKIIPENIYEILTPVALAHVIMGDGSAREYGLTLCTDCYTLSDVIRLINVLILRYGLDCTLQEKRDNQYRIYIKSKSMPLLRSIVSPFMHSSMMYKLGVER